MLRPLLHYGIHFLLPVVVAIAFYRKSWRFALPVLLGGILLDLDHLLATPIFDASRCSIGYHPLHTYPAIAVYVLLLFFPKSRIFGIAALIHMLADSTDCLLMGYGY